MWTNKLVRVLVFLVAPLFGAVLSFVIATVIGNGWLSSAWQQIEKPPVSSYSLVVINEDDLWVRSDKGLLYQNEISPICATNCWIQVSEIPTLPKMRSYDLKVIPMLCAPPPFLARITTSIAECRSQDWGGDRNYMFALLDDGNIYFWTVDTYPMWFSVVVPRITVLGAVVFFVLALLIAFLARLFSGFAKRIKP